MPAFPIIDTHLHVWDPQRVPMAWLREASAVLARPYHVEDYRAACGPVEVEAMVFVECFVDPGHFEDEVRFVEDEARRDARLQAIVAQAPLEDGRRVTDFLARLKDSTPSLRGIRRIIEFDPDPDFCLRPAFIEGVRALAAFDLHFEINVNYRQMDKVLQFVPQLPEVRMILDHCGKPGIREGRLDLFRSHMRALAAFPNVSCKLSDLPVEADRQNWTRAQIVPYVDTVIETFGFERTIYAGDWPVCTQAVSLPDWVALLDEALSGASEAELRRLYRDNATAFYRLTL